MLHGLNLLLCPLSALQSVSGRFLLNGGMVIGIGVREFRAAGSKIWYSGSEKPIEQIKINGKTTEPIKVHVSTVYFSCLCGWKWADTAFSNRYDIRTIFGDVRYRYL